MTPANLRKERRGGIFTAVKANITAKGEIVLPRELCRRKAISPGDGFEVLEDEDDPSVIILRHLAPGANAGLVDHLLACPYKDWFLSPASKPEEFRHARW